MKRGNNGNRSPFDEGRERPLNNDQGVHQLISERNINQDNIRPTDMENSSCYGPAQSLGERRLKKKKDLFSGILSSLQIKKRLCKKVISELEEIGSDSTPAFVWFFKIYCKEMIIFNGKIEPEFQPLSQNTFESKSVVNLEETLSQFAQSDTFDHGLFTKKLFKEICKDSELGLFFCQKKLFFRTLNENLSIEIEKILEKYGLPSSGLPKQNSTQGEFNAFLKELDGKVKVEIAQAIAKMIVSAQDYLKLISSNQLKPAIPESMEWDESADKYIDRTTFLGKQCKFWDSKFEASYCTPKKALK